MQKLIDGSPEDSPINEEQQDVTVTPPALPLSGKAITPAKE
jgi:hypothetical protein